MLMLRRFGVLLAGFCLGWLCLAGPALWPALADDTLRIAVGQRGLWDTSVVELGQRGGIFKKHGIALDILYTQGGGETQQAVISGGVELGSSAGAFGVFGAFAKGAPLRVIGAEMIGGGDLFWYVQSGSPIRSLADTDGRTIAYSTNGASTHAIVMALIRQYDLKARPVATGSPAATLTQVMSGQVDVGWAGPPFGLDLIDQGKIRIIASGDDAAAFRSQTVRLLITNAATLQARRPAIERFMAAYRETVELDVFRSRGVQALFRFHRGQRGDRPAQPRPLLSQGHARSRCCRRRRRHQCRCGRVQVPRRAADPRAACGADPIPRR